MARGWSVIASAASHSFLFWGAHSAPITVSQEPGREQEFLGSLGSGIGWVVGAPAVQSHPISGLCFGDGWWCPSQFSVPTSRHHNQSVEIWVFLSIWTIGFLTTFSVGSTYLNARVRWAVFLQMPP